MLGKVFGDLNQGIHPKGGEKHSGLVIVGSFAKMITR